ncbi:MAG TPA: nucleotidyltransferase family protein, partial [Limnochordales bacterium]
PWAGEVRALGWAGVRAVGSTGLETEEPGVRDRRPRVAAVVLAAGMATRMGALKQVLPVEGEPMVRRVVGTCLAAGLAPVWVVTGFGAEAVEAALGGLPAAVRYVHNPNYKEGQAASLKAGVHAALADKAAAALAVLLADQPFVRVATLRRLAALALEPGVLAAAASYGSGRPGPPCVLRRPLWPQVLALTGDRGARAVLLAAGDGLRTVPVSAEELRDIDAPGDVPPDLPGR